MTILTKAHLDSKAILINFLNVVKVEVWVVHEPCFTTVFLDPFYRRVAHSIGEEVATQLALGQVVHKSQAKVTF